MLRALADSAVSTLHLTGTVMIRKMCLTKWLVWACTLLYCQVNANLRQSCFYKGQNVYKLPVFADQDAIRVTEATDKTRCLVSSNSNEQSVSVVYDKLNNKCYHYKNIPVLPAVFIGGVDDNLELVHNLMALPQLKTSEQTSKCTQPQIYLDCQHAFESGVMTDGVYYIQPQSYSRTILAFCKFDNGKGWTVIQQRQDGSVNFTRDYNEYINGFGYVDTEYWIGLEAIAWLTSVNRKLMIYLEDHDGVYHVVNYTTFYVHGYDDGYRLNVDGFSSSSLDVGDSLDNHNGQKFSAKDHDADSYDVHCAHLFRGGWWYNACHYSNLNGLWADGGITADFAVGINWYTWRDYYYSLRRVHMAISR